MPAWVQRLRARRLVTLPVTIAASLASLASLVVWPSPAVVVDVFQHDGAVLFPFLAELRASLEEHEDEPQSEVDPLAPWMKPRTHEPDIPPSTPSLAPERPIVVMLTIDAMRAEALDDPAIAKRLPRMRALAESAVSFSNARSPCASTRCSFGSMFASKNWSALKWTSDGTRIGKDLRHEATPRLPELLSEAGFTTVHVVSYLPLRNKGRVLGTFEEEHIVNAGTEGQRFPLAHEMVDVALPAIERHRDGPLFLVMHWMDAHEPYDLGGAEGPVLERYIRELETVDAQVGRLWDALDDMGVLDRVIFVLSADHGEGLGDHGVPHHGVALYDVLVRVPLVVRVPGVEARRVDTPVTALDIAPTLLDLLGSKTPGVWMGQSLVGFLRGESPVLLRPIVGDQNKVTSMVIDGKKVIEDRRKHVVEIYDLETDPDEQVNLSGTLGGDEEKRLVKRLRKYFKNHRAGGKGSGSGPVD
jgi:choline-sulfatase